MASRGRQPYRFGLLGLGCIIELVCLARDAKPIAGRIVNRHNRHRRGIFAAPPTKPPESRTRQAGQTAGLAFCGERLLDTRPSPQKNCPGIEPDSADAAAQLVVYQLLTPLWGNPPKIFFLQTRKILANLETLDMLVQRGRGELCGL